MITKYYHFASPTVTGLWRIQQGAKAWQLAFRGGQLVDFESAKGISDLADFMLDVGAIGESNHTLLGAFGRETPDLSRMLAEVVGGAAALHRLRRQHALHRIGALLCAADADATFTPTAVEVRGSLELDALALPYLALRLQPPERLRASLNPWLARPLRLQRNPNIPVAGLQLDREALNVAREFTKARTVDEVLAQHSAAAEALVSQAAALTLIGCEMLVEVAAAPAPKPAVAAVETPVPAESDNAHKLRVPRVNPLAGRSLQDDDIGTFDRVATGVAPPIGDTGEILGNEPPPPVSDTGEILAGGRPVATIASVLDTIDQRLVTDAETMLERLDEPSHRVAVLRDYLAANNPRHGDPGGAMTAALEGLQRFTAAHPKDHVGPLLLSRIYDAADNAALAQVFAGQAKAMAPTAAEVANWKHCS